MRPHESRASRSHRPVAPASVRCAPVAAQGAPRPAWFTGIACLLLLATLHAASLEAAADSPDGPAGAAADDPAFDPAFYRGWDISDFRIRGIEGDLEEELKEGLALAGERKLLWTDYPVFSPETMQADIERTQLFLSRHGRPDARVNPRLDANVQERSVRIVFEVDPGRIVRIADSSTEAFPPHLEPKAEKILALDAERVFTDRLIERRMRELLRILQTSGYARAQVRTEVGFPDSSRAEVAFVVEAGEIYRFGDTRVEGIPDNLEEVARRSVAIESGRTYSPEPLAQAAQNLRLLDLFRRVRVRTEDAGDHRLDVVVELAPRKPQTVETGIGYWTEDQARLAASWKHRNLFEEGRGLSVEGSYSRFLQSAGVRVWKPVLFHSRTRGSIGLEGRREDEENYRLLSGEVELVVRYVASLTTTLRTAIGVAVYDLLTRIDSTGAYPDPGPNLLRTNQSWSRNRLNDRLYPTGGTLLQFSTETGWPGFDFERNYTLLEPAAVVYTTLLDELVLASRLGVGYSLPGRNARDLLPNKRYYSGGANSMRGYQRHQLGPRDSNDKPIGGMANLEASVEMRFPLLWRFYGTLFCDAAQVWGQRTQIRPFDLEVAVGPGLMIRTPVGPIRADLGFPVTPIPESEPVRVFHLSVGHVY